MKLLRGIVDEIFGLFVDDGYLAVAALVLVAVVAAAVKLAGFPPQWGGIVLGIGCILILATSVHRGAANRS